ncbi:MAG TPA: hypothetical protein VF648_21365 [Pyrinomonadaceae bacterium]
MELCSFFTKTENGYIVPPLKGVKRNTARLCAKKGYMENWQIVSVEHELMREQTEPTGCAGRGGCCGCLTSLLLIVVGVVVLRVLAIIFNFF